MAGYHLLVHRFSKCHIALVHEAQWLGLCVYLYVCTFNFSKGPKNQVLASAVQARYNNKLLILLNKCLVDDP